MKRKPPLFVRLLQRLGLSGQASRPFTRRPQVRLCLEALDERLLPSTSPFGSYANLAQNLAVSPSAGIQQVCALSYLGIPQLANYKVQLTTSSGGAGGTLTITSEDANGNFQGSYSNPNLSINALPVHGTLSGSALHFDGTQTNPLPYGKDVQSVTFDGSICLGYLGFSTTGHLRASDYRSATYLNYFSPGSLVSPTSPRFGVVGNPDVTLAQQGQKAMPLLNEVDDSATGLFVHV
jgi:hypothetical protein